MKIDNTINYKAVLYARKSTESEDKQVQSIEDQIKCMKKIAESEGIRILAILEESKSAKAPGKRPVFKQMMRDIEDGKYNMILTWDTSRLSRNNKDGGDLAWFLNDGTLLGIRTHEKWYRDDDDLLLTIENTMNGRFIKELRAKVKRGMDSKADKGEYPHYAPIGYINNPLKKVIEKDPATFDLVAQLWQKALTGVYTTAELTRIARDELRLRTKKTTRQGGKPLCHNAIRNLLKNPFYAGKFMWNGQEYNGNHPAMISYAQFEHVQEIFNPNHATRPQKDPYQFILRGMITCKECGYAIVTEKHFKKLRDGTKKEFRYCHCCGKNPEKKCPNRSVYVSESELIEQIKNELGKYTIDEDFYKIALEVLAEEDEIEVSRQNERIGQINKQISDKKNQLDSLRRSIYTGLITDEAFILSEQESLEKDISRLEEQLNEVKTVATNWREAAMDVFMFARYAKEDFDSDDWERKRLVIKQLGADLKLSGRTIEFTPVKYLVPVAENHATLQAKKEAARTAPQQMKKDLKEDLFSSWCARLDLNQHARRHMLLRHTCIPISPLALKL